MPYIINQIATTEIYGDLIELKSLPEEQVVVLYAVPKRRNEFNTVRSCAHRAINEIRVDVISILKGLNGEPCWPKEVTGSITHCYGFRGAVVCKSEAIQSIGIDAEPYTFLPEGVMDSISLPAERFIISSMHNSHLLFWDKILFSAKEATYKAWYLIMKQCLEFKDIYIKFFVDNSITNGTFKSQITTNSNLKTNLYMLTLNGCWSVLNSTIITVVIL